jgi:hypothetical protein
VLSEIRFTVEPWQPSGILLTPCIGGRSFVELVTEYEEAQNWDDAGIHEGLVLAPEDIEVLPQYFLHGRSLLRNLSHKGTVLLGCTCGNVDDGPFFGQVQLVEDRVTWFGFENPMADSLAWDYTGFGPFTFDREHYEQAIADAMAEALA